MSRIVAAASRTDLLASGGTRAVLLQLDGDEADALASLAGQVETLLSESDPASPGLTRLFPVAYSDDTSAAAEFARYTRPELQKRKIDAAVTVREAVEAASALGIDDERYGHNIEIDPEALLAWLTFLTDLRLVLADSIGVADDGSLSDAAAAASEELAQLRELQRGVYDWAAFLQDSLIGAVEADLP
ncbi:DUF2017 family protein [Microterricola viridarii]|uniref:Uncharacterized protein n=1 Tax=Microterricola viridarii TaxID=412690 RepID=A0A1H1LF65_9MICO|nr:DUF2017 family protein [Microterricola viridarii]SDR73221.1 protein of unknown function [Microterricola viridarii]